jgi:hypothetical protein
MAHLSKHGTSRANCPYNMRRDDPTFRMRRDQLGELVSLTSQLPAQRVTAEMPAVELQDLLRKDRELEVEAEPIAAEHFDVSVRYETTVVGRLPPPPQLAVGTAQIERQSRAAIVLLVIGCLLAFGGGFALTLPLWLQ